MVIHYRRARNITKYLRYYIKVYIQDFLERVTLDLVHESSNMNIEKEMCDELHQ
jgi:hypothetical protein